MAFFINTELDDTPPCTEDDDEFSYTIGTGAGKTNSKGLEATTTPGWFGNDLLRGDAETTRLSAMMETTFVWG